METTIMGYIRVILGFYRGYQGIMEKNMETTIMENQMEKKKEHEMEIGIIGKQVTSGRTGCHPHSRSSALTPRNPKP